MTRSSPSMRGHGRFAAGVGEQTGSSTREFRDNGLEEDRRWLIAVHRVVPNRLYLLEQTQAANQIRARGKKIRAKASRSSRRFPARAAS